MTLIINERNPTGKNCEISEQELAKIRRLGDFDLIMFVSEVHDFGWAIARRTLAMIPEKN